MKIFNMGKIILNVINYEMVYDQLDTSFFNIIFEGGYFNIQSSAYIDPDFEYSEIAYFELSGQENGRYLDPEKIIFLKKELVDFFNNCLFFGEFIQYSSDFDKHKIVRQTLDREVIDCEEDIE